METLKASLIAASYPGTFMLKDIPDASNEVQQTFYHLKFRDLLEIYRRGGKVIVPIFYIHPAIDQGHGKGMIVEFVQVIQENPHLREYTIVLKHEGTDFIQHLEMIHPRNRYNVGTIQECIEKVISHVQGHEPFITEKLNNSGKILYSSNSSNNEKRQNG